MAKRLVALWAVILIAAGVRVEAAAAPEAFLADAESTLLYDYASPIEAPIKSAYARRQGKC